MGIIDVNYKSFCPICGYCELTLIKTIDICPVCNNKMKKTNFLQRRKFDNFNQEQLYDYIQKEIIKTNFDSKMVELRKKYEQRKYAEYQQQKSEREQKERSKISAYQTKYLSFLEEAQNQGILRSRAEEIASYAMQHEMYSLPHCPSCGSVNANKISTETKVAKTAAFGVYGAMSDSGKTWKCNKCGCKW